jgi:lysophospholipase L1-like esterase
MVSSCTVLFQGDSITDAGRNRSSTVPNAPDGIGWGYVFHAAAALLADRPGQNLAVYNRGVSGDRVVDLAQRWQQDCLALKPDVLSVLIGVNDTWHGLEQPQRAVPLDQYEQVYRRIVSEARSANSAITLVLCEPFVLRCGQVNDSWFPEMNHRQAIVKRIAADAGAIFVPFQAMFDRAVQHAPPAYWAADGVHPTMAAHLLMARTWLAAVADAR